MLWRVHQAAEFFSFQPVPVGWQCFAEADHLSEDEVCREGLAVDHLGFSGALWGCASRASKKWGCSPDFTSLATKKTDFT